MTNILTLSSSNRAACKQQVLNLDTIRLNKVNFGEKGLSAPGPKNGTTFHNQSSLLKIFQPRRIFKNFGTLPLTDVIYAKPLRSEDFACRFFVFCIHTNTILRFVNLKTMCIFFLSKHWLQCLSKQYYSWQKVIKMIWLKCHKL